MNRTMIWMGLACAALLAAGCDRRGPAERAGEKLDTAVDTIKNGGHEPVADSVRDAADKARDKVQDAAHDAAEKAKDNK
ncbi:MAG TPA: hypothetical protein VLX90_04240 [Steroidobacteraceae bacterium]|nr:hypothetical protein [Steroidobacteraceae bacterium]